VVARAVVATAAVMGVMTGEEMVEERAAARAGAVTGAVTVVAMGGVTGEEMVEERAMVRFREGMAAGAGIATVRRSTGLQERRAGTLSLEDDGGAAALPIERVQTSLRTG
jgi:hypothetical protein